MADLVRAQKDLESAVGISQTYATNLMLHMERILQFARNSQESITDAELLSRLADMQTQASAVLKRLQERFSPTDVALTFEGGSVLPQLNLLTAHNTVAEHLQPIQTSPSPTNEFVYIQSPRAIAILHTLDILSDLNTHMYENRDISTTFPYIHAHTYNKIIAHLTNI
jgi:hypothetical protein